MLRVKLVLRTAPADTMSRATFALVLALLQPAYSQFRCHLGDVRKSDGTYSIGNCDELLLHGEKIGDEGTEALAAALPSAGRLRLLDLWSNGLGKKGAEALARALEKNSKLEKLYLNENAIGAEGALALAKALTKNRALATLWLSRNGLGDEGAEAIASTALRNTAARRLEALDLWGNGITWKGGTAIADALKSNHQLRTLELRDNDMGDQTAKAFADMMPKNHALATLDLVSTGTTSTGRDALLAGLKESTANPYLVIFAEGLPHFQATSWGEKGKPNAP